MRRERCARASRQIERRFNLDRLAMMKRAAAAEKELEIRPSLHEWEIQFF